MKSDKGQSVFSDSIDSILADKIIEHSDTNCTNETENENDDLNNENPCKPNSFKVKNVAIMIFSAIFLIIVYIIYLSGIKDKFSR